MCHSSRNRKKELFCGVPNLTIITPSYWLKRLVEESFLKEYPVDVLYNENNTDIFKPTFGGFRRRYGIEDKKIVLGVASTWEPRKGLDDFVSLSKMLDDTFRIVLIGVTQEQAKGMPENILPISRTNNQQELAEIYTTADVHVVASKEETFGMTILEAYYCGTPSVVYRDTACEEVAEKFGGEIVSIGAENLCAGIFRVLNRNV